MYITMYKKYNLMLSNEHISIVLHTGKNEFTKNIEWPNVFYLFLFLENTHSQFYDKFLYEKYDYLDLIPLVLILY